MTKKLILNCYNNFRKYLAIDGKIKRKLLTFFLSLNEAYPANHVRKRIFSSQNYILRTVDTWIM